MQESTLDLAARIERRAQAIRRTGKCANRYVGRAQVVLVRHAARLGDTLPTLYVTGKGGETWLTTWTGNRIARIYATGQARAFNVTLTCYSATICGRRYYGRGHGPGMYINLRAGKAV